MKPSFLLFSTLVLYAIATSFIFNEYSKPLTSSNRRFCKMWYISSLLRATGVTSIAIRFASASSSRKLDCNNSLPDSYAALRSEKTRHTFANCSLPNAVKRFESAVMVTLLRSELPTIIDLAFSKYGGSSSSKMRVFWPLSSSTHDFSPGALRGE